ncbi:aminotransferase class IV [Desulfobacter vibrioformis]|uniref:aminotransferase class IV n=1 Tax=Desulfobacter vibrioformis TaxID=34031 RepID=UPI00054F7FC5|nr:aminotransferase class IV [Desulfobacter vibrioformis]
MDTYYDTYYIDGKFVSEDKATLSVKDITVLRGFGVFDFLITYNKRPFRLEKHVARLENSARHIGLELNHSNKEICDIVMQTIERNPHHKEDNIRIVYTGGISPDGVTPQGNGILMVMVTPKHELPDWWYTQGAKIITVDIERFIPQAKSTNYLSAIFAQQKASSLGAVEAIYKDKDNRLLEGTTTNIFAFKGTTLITPPDGILPGVTRGAVLELLEKKYDIVLDFIPQADLADIDEVFIAASNKEIVPVIQVDDTVISDGKPGEKTLALMADWNAYTTAYGLGETE